MKNSEFFSAFNKLMMDKKIPFQFSTAQGISKLTNKQLSFVFNKVSDLLSLEGIGPDGELNQLGLLYDEICGKLSSEMIRRPGFKLDIIRQKQ